MRSQYTVTVQSECVSVYTTTGRPESTHAQRLNHQLSLTSSLFPCPLASACIWYAGEIPPNVFVLLLKGQAILNGCGDKGEGLTLPSKQAIAEAPGDVIRELRAVREADLSFENLGIE